MQVGKKENCQDGVRIDQIDWSTYMNMRQADDG